jgi:hypothetical protein
MHFRYKVKEHDKFISTSKQDYVIPCQIKLTYEAINKMFGKIYSESLVGLLKFVQIDIK